MNEDNKSLQNNEAAEAEVKELKNEPAAEESTTAGEPETENTAQESTVPEEAAKTADAPEAENNSPEKAAETAPLSEAADSKGFRGIVIGIVIVIVVIAGAIGFKYFMEHRPNKYNEMGYVNTSGRTIAEVADQGGMSLEEFLEYYNLPKNMPGDTEESAAFYTIPLGTIAEKIYETDYESFKEELELGDEFNENTTWGEALDNVKLGIYVAGGDEEVLKEFKEYYGLGDEVTADTLWKEVRNKVDQKNKEDMEAAEAAEEAAAAQAEREAQDSDAAPAEGTDAAPAEDADAAAQAPAAQ